MRIGRNLTVTEIDNRITNYIQNYELTETQINNMMSNVDGAIGCLAEICGVNSKYRPILALQTYNKIYTIGMNAPIEWDTIVYNHADCELDVTKKQITPTYSGEYLITACAWWAASAVGYRVIETLGTATPQLRSVIPATGSISAAFLLSGMVSLEAAQSFNITLHQSTGADLNLSWAYLLVRRMSIGTVIKP